MKLQLYCINNAHTVSINYYHRLADYFQLYLQNAVETFYLSYI